jgi:hypothetical protein
VQQTPLHIQDVGASQNENQKPAQLFPVEPQPEATVQTIEKQQLAWFQKWWPIYWRHVARKPAWKAFQRHVRTESRFQQVVWATEQQKPAMMAREPDRRPHGATWLNGERWEDDEAEYIQGAEVCPQAVDVAPISDVREETEAQRRAREEEMRARLRASKASV